MKKSTLHKLNSCLLLVASAVWLAWPTPASAEPKTWLGTMDGSWLTGENWSPGALSTPGDGVIYNASSTGNLTQTLNQNWAITNLTVGAVPSPVTISGANGLTNSGPIDMSAASADLTIQAHYHATIASGASATIAAGRTLAIHNTSGNMNNATGPGTLRLTGTKAGQFLDLKGGITLSVDGGSVSSGPPVRLTAGADETVLVEVKNSGAINLVNTGNAIKLNVGNNASVTGTNILRCESGTIWITNSSGTAANGIFVANENCYGILDINGGTVDLTNKFTAAASYGGESVLRVPGHAAGQAVVNLNGGVLIVPKVDSAAALVYESYFYFNGGVMRANRSGAQWMVPASGFTTFVKAGGAILDTVSYDTTISQSLTGDPASPGGSLTKLGSGILRLTGYNTYTGPTVVTAGTLAVAMATGSYPTESALVASNGTTLNVDISGGSTLQTPSASLNGVTLNLTYGTLSGNPSQAAINNSSFSGIPLTATGTNVINISGIGFAENGVVPLIDYSGAIGGSGYAAFKLGTLPIAVSGVLSNDTANGMIVLHLGQVPAMLTWYGDKSANWDTSTLNWNFGSVSYDQTGGVGDIVTFDDALEATALNTNVVLTTTLTPAIAQVMNSTYEYVFSGPGKLGGTGMLTKGGTAALTLVTANNYSGGSYLTNGALRVGNDAALGVGTVNLLGATLSSDSATARTLTNAVLVSAATTFGDGVNNGVLTLAGPVSFNGGTRNLTNNTLVIITGGSTNGGLNKVGTNTLVFLNCTNTFTSGSSEIRQGTVALTNALITSSAAFRPACTVPGGEARLVIGPGSVWENSGAAGSFRLGTQGTTGDPTGTNIADIAGELRLPNATPPNGRFMFSSNYVGFANLLPGGLATVTAVVSEGGTNNTAYQEFNFNGGTLRAMTNATTAFMEGLGAAYVRGGGAVVDSAGANITIAQALLNGGGGGGLTKQGLGTLTLSGTNSYTGPTLVGAGTLQVNGNSAVATGNTTVQSGGTLGGTGLMGAAVTVNPGGALAPGAASLGALTLTSTLTLRGIAVMELSRDGGSPANDVVAGLAGISYGGSLVLTNIGASQLLVDDTFVLFSATPGSYGGGFTNIVVPAGYTFDTTKLTVDGSVKVTGVPTTIPSTPTNISYGLAGNQLTISWPEAYRGCTLQSQTNGIGVGLSTNWVEVPNSTTSTSVTLTVDPALGSVFFRLRHP